MRERDVPCLRDTPCKSVCPFPCQTSGYFTELNRTKVLISAVVRGHACPLPRTALAHRFDQVPAVGYSIVLSYGGCVLYLRCGVRSLMSLFYLALRVRGFVAVFPEVHIGYLSWYKVWTSSPCNPICPNCGPTLDHG